MIFERNRSDFLVSTDPRLLDSAAIHAYLSLESYWARGIPLAVLQKALEHSLCFGVYREHRQVGFARVITDCATYMYLCDVYVLESERGQGLGKWLMECITAHPELQGLRRMSLVTADAHGLYAQFGFVPPARPGRYMEKLDPDVYTRAAQEI
jgi:GNAT superfamily N-acetyltransferase